ncbi:M48 family metallopeptidase [Sulfurimonas sp.]
MPNIIYNDILVEVIHNPKLKNSYIKIGHNKSVTIKTPHKSKKYLLEMLNEREGWIRKQLKKIDSYTTFHVNLEDEVLIFGEIYSIDSPQAKELRESLHKLRVNSKSNILKSYDNFYKNLAKKILKQRVEHFSSVMQLKYSEIKYRKMKSRWGSCSSKGVITLNCELVKLDKKLIDYVVVHELSHLVHMNHSKQFHMLVDSYLEGSKELRKQLKEIRLLA